MSDDAASRPPAGFYPDPSGGTDRRWWDGQRWTDRVEQAYTGNGIVQPELPAGAKVDTVWIWLIAVLPILAILPFFAIDLPGYLRASLDPTGSEIAGYFARIFLLQGLSLVILAANVVFAYFDWRRLKRVGVVRPFHWAWAFLNVVYPIGRAVVVRRRSGRGLGPLWLWIAVLVVGMVLSFVIFGVAMSDLLNSPEFQQELRFS